MVCLAQFTLYLCIEVCLGGEQAVRRNAMALLCSSAVQRLPVDASVVV